MEVNLNFIELSSARKETPWDKTSSPFSSPEEIGKNHFAEAFAHQLKAQASKQNNVVAPNVLDDAREDHQYQELKRDRENVVLEDNYDLERPKESNPQENRTSLSKDKNIPEADKKTDKDVDQVAATDKNQNVSLADLNQFIKQLEQFVQTANKGQVNVTPLWAEGFSGAEGSLKSLLAKLKEIMASMGGNKAEAGAKGVALDKQIAQWLESLKSAESLPNELKSQIKKLLSLKDFNKEPSAPEKPFPRLRSGSGGEPSAHEKSSAHKESVGTSRESTTPQEAKSKQSLKNSTHNVIANEGYKTPTTGTSQQGRGLANEQPNEAPRAFKAETVKVESSFGDRAAINSDLSKLYSSQTREIEPQRILSRLLSQIRGAIVNNKDQVILKLYPDHLGKVTVFLNKDEGVLSARLVVDSGAVKELLESKMQDLKDHLANSGLSFAELSIDLSNNNPKGGEKEELIKTNASGDGATSLSEEQETQLSELDVYRANPQGLLDLIA